MGFHVAVMAYDWFEIARLPAIRQIAEILRRRLNVWVGVTSAAGLVTYVGEQQAVDKPLCDAFMLRSDDRSCAQSYRQWFSEAEARPDGPLFVACHAGLRGAVTPVCVDGGCVAAFFVSGFVINGEADFESQVVVRGQELQLNKTTIQQGCRELVRLTQREAQLLIELLAEIARQAEDFIGQNRARVHTPRLANVHDYSHIIGQSQAMQQLFRLLDKVCASESTVLIEGPAGVGKELVARAIHYNGARANAPFVIQNCSALNDSLLDSELFGHKRGAFTGALVDKPGLFEVAHKGTFFLDEIGDMSPQLQVKLLRVLQEGTFVPVGDSVTRKVDVRIVAATNRDLAEMVRTGAFRQDLYYRINVINLKVPSLAARRDDIPPLLRHFLAKKSAENRKPLKQLDDAAIASLVAYDWPGNVRELENEIERLVVLSPEQGPIPNALVSARIRRDYTPAAPAMHAIQDYVHFYDAAQFPVAGNIQTTLESIEKDIIIHVLNRNDWNRTKAAQDLGISRRNLIRKIERFEIAAPEQED